MKNPPISSISGSFAVVIYSSGRRCYDAIYMDDGKLVNVIKRLRTRADGFGERKVFLTRGENKVVLSIGRVPYKSQVYATVSWKTQEIFEIDP